IDEQHADRLGNGGVAGDAGEAAGVRVDAKDGEIIGGLRGAEQPGAVGAEGEIARVASAAGNRFDEREHSGGGVAFEHGNAVVSAVGGVDEAVVGVDPNLG